MKTTTPSDKQRAACKRWYNKNKVEVSLYKRRVYLANREKLLDRNRCWRMRNPQAVRAIQQRWRLNNREKVRDISRRAYLKNRDSLLAKRNSPTFRAARREQKLRRDYGLTLAGFEAINKKQNGLCAICKKTCQKRQLLCVDHCHTTGLVRGLLCDKCNRGLGFFNDDFSTLIRAAHYVGRN